MDFQEARIDVLEQENEKLKEKLDIAVKAMKLARDSAYSSSKDCPKCSFIEGLLTKAIKESEE
ncbi:MAG: hypothetical protein NC124_02575 [Clostridium sp.]|nr:hypothetical protein [Clostridium sp.]